MTVLEARGLVLRLGASRVLDGVDLAVAAGQVLGVAGGSGAGKSTLARVLAGLLRPEAGTVTVAGGARRGGPSPVQLVWQQPAASLDPRLTLGQSIAEPLRYARALPRAGWPARVAALLGQVGLDGAAAGRYPHELSGGQCQRAAIARALAAAPAVLICDEATSALDVLVQRQVLDLLVGLARREGLALVLISHDLPMLAGACDELCVMQAGRIVERGTPATLLAAPRHPHTQRLLAAARALAGAADVLSGDS